MAILDVLVPFANGEVPGLFDTLENASVATLLAMYPGQSSIAVAVGSFASAFKSVGPDLFGSFAARYPGIELTVCGGVSVVSLRRREADVVLRMSESPAPHLVGRRLRDLKFVPAASRELLDRMGPQAPLSTYPWVSDDLLSATASSDAWLRTLAPEATVALRFDSYGGVRSAVRAGIGASLLWQEDVHADPALVELPTTTFSVAQGLWALTLQELKANSRVRAFMDHLWQRLGVR